MRHLVPALGQQSTFRVRIHRPWHGHNSPTVGLNSSFVQVEYRQGTQAINKSWGTRPRREVRSQDVRVSLLTVGRGRRAYHRVAARSPSPMHRPSMSRSPSPRGEPSSSPLLLTLGGCPSRSTSPQRPGQSKRPPKVVVLEETVMHPGAPPETAYITGVGILPGGQGPFSRAYTYRGPDRASDPTCDTPSG